MCKEWKVQTGKGKSAYTTKYTLPNEYRAWANYHALNTFNGYKKRLIDPNGRVVARFVSQTER
jgi:glutathione peroxidase-family protein